MVTVDGEVCALGHGAHGKLGLGSMHDQLQTPSFLPRQSMHVHMHLPPTAHQWEYGFSPGCSVHNIAKCERVITHVIGEQFRHSTQGADDCVWCRAFCCSHRYFFFGAIFFSFSGSHHPVLALTATPSPVLFLPRFPPFLFCESPLPIGLIKRKEDDPSDALPCWPARTNSYL